MSEEQLKALETLGVNYDEIIGRFMGKADFYIRMIKKLPADKSFKESKEALEKGDYAAMLAATHTLKGLVGNFGFQKLIDDICPLNEALRKEPYDEAYIRNKFEGIERNYQEAMEVINTKFAKLEN